MAGIGTLQVVDERDLTTVLGDFNDGTRTFAREFHLRVPPIEATRFSPPSGPGGFTTWSKDPLVETAWKQVLLYSDQTYDQMAVRARELVRLLRRGGVLKCVLTGSADTFYIDYEKGSGFALFGEEPEDTFRALTSRAYPDGAPVTILRQPSLRLADLDPNVNKLTNCCLVSDVNRDGTPDGWTKDNGTLTIDAASESFQIVHNAAIDLARIDYTIGAGTQIAASIEARVVGGDRTVQFKLISRPSGTVLATGTVTATAWGTRVSAVGTVAVGDTSVRIQLSYSGGSSSTTSQWKNVQLETGTLTPSAFRVGVETVAMDPSSSTNSGRVVALYNGGDMPAPFLITATCPDAGAKVASLLLAVRGNEGIVGHRSLTEFMNATHFGKWAASANGWTATLGDDTTSVADGAEGNVAQCSFATVSSMSRRVRETRSTVLDSLRGYFDVYVRVKATAALRAVLQLRSGPSIADPAPYSEPEVVFDRNDATTFGYEDVRVGTIFLQDDPSEPIGALALEVLARRELGAGSLNFHSFTLVPLDDDVIALSVLGGSKETWLGKDLVTPTNPGGLSAGTVKNNRLRMDVANEAGGTPPNSGLSRATGRHRISFATDGSGTMTFVGRVRNITDSADAVSLTRTSKRPSAISSQIVLEFDVGVAPNDVTDKYQAQILPTGGVGAQEYMDAKKIDWEFLPYIAQNEGLRADPAGGLAWKVDASGNAVAVLGVDGPLPALIPPGLWILVVIAADIKVDSVAGGDSKLARTFSISAKHAPRRAL